MPGRTRNSETIRGRFLEELEKNGIRPLDPRKMPTLGGVKLFENTTELYVTKLGYIHVHVRSEGEGFWGLRQGIVAKLRQLRILGIPQYLILLKGRLQEDAQRRTDHVADGYIISIADWYRLQGDAELSQSLKGDYKIHEETLRALGCERILSIQEVVRRLAEKPVPSVFQSVT